MNAASEPLPDDEYKAWMAAVRSVRQSASQVMELHASDGAEAPFCVECGHAWPCHTRRILVGEQIKGIPDTSKEETNG